MSLISLVYHSILQRLMSTLFTKLQKKNRLCINESLFLNLFILQIQLHTDPGSRWPRSLPARDSRPQQKGPDHRYGYRR